jgi:hypothetical protein
MQTMDYPQPSATDLQKSTRAVQRLDGGGPDGLIYSLIPSESWWCARFLGICLFFVERRMGRVSKKAPFVVSKNLTTRLVTVQVIGLSPNQFAGYTWVCACKSKTRGYTEMDNEPRPSILCEHCSKLGLRHANDRG